MSEFIKPCEAIRILKISRESLRRNYQKMQIRRTKNKPFFYSKFDCEKYAKERFEVEQKFNDPRALKLSRKLKKSR